MAEEKIQEQTSAKTDVTLAEKRAAKKALKKRKKFEKKELKRLKKEHERRAAILPAAKRPIICPPDCSDSSKNHVIIGMILRVFVLFIAVAGMTMFVTEAFGFDMTPEYLASKDVNSYAGVAAGADFGYVALWSAIFVALIALAGLWKYGALVSIPAIGAIVVVSTLPNPVQYFYELALTVFNGVLGHMKFMGFYAMDLKQVSVSHTMGTPTELVRTAVMLFALITAAVYVPAFIKRARIILPAIYSTGIMVFLFVYNLSRSNWALAFIIMGFSAIIVMYVYDRIFIVAPKPDETDETGNIFGETDAPQLPDRLLKKAELKASAKERKLAKKAEKKARKQGKKITVDQEISEYFADSAAKPKKEKVHLTPAEKREAKKAKAEAKAQKKAELREDKAAVSKVRAYHDNILTRRAAIGGFAGAGMLVLALIVVALPAMATKGSFETIPAIDEKLEYYREYVTAYLMGDDPALDILAFEGDANNFSPHNTMATPRYYTHEILMDVESNYTSNIYLRGWIGTDYEDGVWYTAKPNSDLIERYRSLFAINDDASESIYYNFFKIMTEDGVFAADRDVTESLKRLDKYGYTIAQVNMKRTEDFDDNILYMPSFHIRAYSPSGVSSTGNATNFLRKYGSSEASEISYANFFDGLYTSYRAAQNGTEGYAAVAMITNMRSDSFHYNIANLIAEFNQTRIAVENGKNKVLVNAEDERLGTFSLTLHDGSVFEYTVVSIAEDGTKVISVAQEKGTAIYTIAPDGNVSREMIDTPLEYDEYGEVIEYYAPKLIKAVLYFEYMDATAQWQFRRQAELLDKYTPYVYETYTKKSGSKIISDLYKQIVSEAVIEKDYQEPVPADFSLAAEQSVYKYNEKKETYTLTSLVTNRDVYVQRHELVMEIINYLCQDDRYKYTLYPTVLGEENTLDGIETFLTKTKEGYCVQFASSLALLLREAGIPARYVEGYIATGFYNHRGEDAVSRYKTSVRDSSAHAWVEVWYDGIGWVQYEATPEYYEAMYVSSRPSTGTTRPGDATEEEPEEEDPYEGLTEYEIQQMLEEQRREEIRQLIIKICIIAGSVLAFAAIVIIFFAIVIKRANKRAEIREKRLESLFTADEEAGSIPEREDVRRVGEMIMSMLRESGFVPADGEFSAEFASRIASECERELCVAAPEEGMSEFEAHRHPIRENEAIRIFEAIAAEEFGNGAPVRDMPSMAKLYYRLRVTVYKRKVTFYRRAVIYLFKKDN